MADPLKVDDPIAALLDGWGTPPPREDFVDRVTAKIGADTVATRRRSRGRFTAFALGALAAGSVMAIAIGLGRSQPSSVQRSTHVLVPGVADVVGEPGARLRWERRDDGGLAVEVVEGVAWLRPTEGGPPVTIVADGEPEVLGRACTRVEVKRGLISTDANVDDANCDTVQAAIDRARAELSD
jgi:hypothetical protein